ncbi:hypothetical protein [Actinoplanes siamensis]|uniref:Phosphodiesterase n=1 Tax=Actinoplanes siamensis TaxID=1223317 RepID=A0A919N5Y6_9ACTN|nr:hypothetical protein [Actinoplanes siamensis]GIF04934.1 hypothetical protein Asi03nite_24720 [Actinoplanes siamensis]
MNGLRWIGAGVAVAAGMRLARSRRQRSLHPAGRSMTAELEIWGCVDPTGSTLLDRPGHYDVVVRLSKGVGTRRARPDVRGIALRVEGTDLLLSTVGPGRWGRRLPMPRRTFDARYGSIAAYRSGTGGKLYLAAGPDPSGRPLGRSLDTVGKAATLLLYAIRGPVVQPFGRVTLKDTLSPETDAALAFDPIRNAGDDLRPTGLLHGVRGIAYRASQRWRGARPQQLPGSPQ